MKQNPLKRVIAWLDPVSYTHLKKFRKKGLVASVAPSWIFQRCLFLANAHTLHAPVSYTHLVSPGIEPLDAVFQF